MKSVTTLLVILASCSVILQPVIGAALPKDNVPSVNQPTRVAVPDTEPRSVARPTNSPVQNNEGPSMTKATRITRPTNRVSASPQATNDAVPNIKESLVVEATDVPVPDREAPPAIKATDVPDNNSEGPPGTKTTNTATSKISYSQSQVTGSNLLTALSNMGVLDIKLAECTGELFSNSKNLDKLWVDSGVEIFVDRWLSKQKDHSNWSQKLLAELFGVESLHTEMSCINTEASCDLNRSCGDFNKIGKGALYYLFVSLANFHKFMKGYRTRYFEESFLASLKIEEIATKLGIREPIEEPKEFDIFGMLSGALGIAGGFVPNPAVAGAMGVMTGVIDMLGDASSKPPIPKAKDWKEVADGVVAEGMKESLHNIDTIVSAVFGNKVSQNEIPKSMRHANVKNPALAVFGGGRWLQDNPTDGLQKQFEQTRKRMEQGLAWQMAKHFRHTWVIIRDDLNNPNRCSNPNNAWDSEKNRCLDMMGYDGTPKGTFGGINDINIWESFGMDKLATMRNSVDCWVNNKGRAGAPSPLAEPFKSSDTPPCFFSHEVLQGTRVQKNRGGLRLNGNFPGQETRNNVMWPSSKRW